MDLIGGYGSDASEEEAVALPTVTAAPAVLSFAHTDGSSRHMVDAHATTLTSNPTVGEMYSAVPVSASGTCSTQRPDTPPIPTAPRAPSSSAASSPPARTLKGCQ